MRATTENGSVVELLQDGTWRPASPSAPPEDAGFRGVQWGASRMEILAREGRSPDRETDRVLIFQTRLADLGCEAVYILLPDGRLVRAKYLVIDSYSNDQRYLATYDSLRELLGKKYGKPTEENTYWSDELYQDDPSNWGMAVSAGHMARYTNWYIGDTHVLLYLTGNNFEISVGVEYGSVKLREVENAMDESRTLGDL